MNHFKIEFNRNYGVNRRTGWTITWNGCLVVQLEPWLIVAIWKAWRFNRILRRDQRTYEREWKRKVDAALEEPCSTADSSSDDSRERWLD